MIVAIDGPAGAGKSAVGRRVAQALGLPFVDSDLMYRALALLARERGIELTDVAALVGLAATARLSVNGRGLAVDGEDYTERAASPELSGPAALVAGVAGVRLALLEQRRALGREGVVMSGLDVGTVVFPDTPHKFFLAPGGEERNRRPAGPVQVADPEQLRRQVAERDRLDSHRSLAPVRPAADAVLIDTGRLELDGAVAEILRHLRQSG